MCRKLVVTNKLSLGSRELGWETYSLPKGEVLEFTSKQLKDAIKQGTDEVYGLKLDEETGELVFDKEGFFTTNMMQKVHINTLTPIIEDDCLANLFYIVNGVSYRVSDKRYLYRYSLYGQTKYIYAKELTEMKKKIAQLQLDVAMGRNTNLAEMTLNEWYPQYLEIYKRGKVKETTFLNLEHYYQWYIEKYTIGRMPMRELKRSHIVAHFQQLAREKELAHGTLRSLASALHDALQQVVYDSGMFVNPASEIMKDVVAKPKEIRDALSDEQVQLLLDFLKIEGTWQNVYLPLIGILLGTGMRYGECVGLTWRDVDLEKKVIHISHTLNYRCKDSAEHKYFITTPKTVNAVRKIPLNDDLVELFKVQKRYQKNMKIRQDIEIDGMSGFIFTSKLGWPLTHEGTCSSLKRIVTSANEWEKERAKEQKRNPIILPKLTPHIFRHTFATALVLKGVSHEITKVVMGHSSIRTTLDIYTHIKLENMKRIRSDIGDVVKIF